MLINIKLYLFSLTHWGQVPQIYISKFTIIGSDNDLLPGQGQAIIWTSAGILLTRLSGTNLSETLIEIHILHSRKHIWKSRLRNVSHFVTASMC